MRLELFKAMCNDVMPGYLLSDILDVNTVDKAKALWDHMQDDIFKHHSKYSKNDCVTTHLAEVYSQCMFWWWENCDKINLDGLRTNQCTGCHECTLTCPPEVYDLTRE